MHAIRAWLARLGELVFRQRRDLELAAEMESHLQMHIADGVRSGLAPEEARRQAVLALGGIDQTKENYRDRRGFPALEAVIQDVRFGVRMLRKNPGFTAVAVLTLALGIGATTAIFAVVNTVLIRPLPFRGSSSLVMLWENFPSCTRCPFSAPDFTFFQRSQNSFKSMGIFQNKEFDISGNGQPERVMAARVSASIFPMLGIEPLLGRTFTPEEDTPGSNVVLLGYGLWQRRYASDKGIIGRSIEIDRQPYTVVGVMPRSFAFPVAPIVVGIISSSHPADLWVPMALTRTELEGWGNMYNSDVIARLKPGTTIAQADSEAELLSNRLTALYPPAVMKALNVARIRVAVYSYQQEVAGPVREPLLVLMAAVGLVFFISCTNVATLMLSRAATRHREIAVRTALGATRTRVIRQLLTEGLLLAVTGGALGLIVARWGMSLLLSLVPPDIPLPQQVSIGAVVVLFVGGISIITALLFGLAPALQLSSLPFQQGLQEGGRSATSGRTRQRLRGVLVTIEFAMALVLLVGAGLLIRSFAKLVETNPGFRPDNVLTLSLPLPYSAYPKAPPIRSFYEQLLEQIAGLPGVAAAGFSNDLPLESRDSEAFQIEKSDSSTINRSQAATWVLGNYFEATGISLLKGRWFTPEDRADSQSVAIISQTLARRFWPNEDAVGKRIRWGTSPKLPWRTVVGVASDVNDSRGLRARVYMPYLQVPDETVQENVVGEWRSMNLAIRTRTDPEALASAVVGRIHSLDPELAAAHIRTMTQILSSSVAAPRFNTVLLGIFGGVAMFLAVIGVYGVLAYMVTEQTHEIGIRTALGAERGEILRLVLKQGAKLAGAGVAIGLFAALGLTRLLRGLLYGVTVTDPVTFASVAILLMTAALIACYIPARRAMRVDPAVALRHE
jgi:putative ABC transport system permease protein